MRNSEYIICYSFPLLSTTKLFQPPVELFLQHTRYSPLNYIRVNLIANDRCVGRMLDQWMRILIRRWQMRSKRFRLTGQKKKHIKVQLWFIFAMCARLSQRYNSSTTIKSIFTLFTWFITQRPSQIIAFQIMRVAEYGADGVCCEWKNGRYSSP